MIKGIQLHYDKFFEDSIHDAASAGFQYVSIAFCSDMAIDALTSDDYEDLAEKIDSILKQRGLICIQSHLPYYNLTVSAEKLDDRMELAIKRCIKISAKLGAQWTVYHPRSYIEDGIYYSDKALEINLKVIRDYANIAQECEISLALENLLWLPTMPKFNFYVNKPWELIELVDKLNHPAISICWDFGHANLASYWLNYDHAEAIRSLGKRLSCTHVHNNSVHYDNHLPPSIGDIKWDKLLPIMKEIGYEGAYMLEPVEINDETRESYFVHLYQCMKKLERILEQ